MVGVFNPDPQDQTPPGTATLVLLGPGGPEMWQVFANSPEHADDEADPLDRWSARVIGTMSRDLDATALFPSSGPPWHPFQRWAERGEGAVSSPVRMQATAGRGLWASYRGALAFQTRIELPLIVHENPCLGCPAPCTTSCPVDALAGAAYDVPRCTAHVRSEEGAACRSGCLVRRSCPAGMALGLPEAQRAFHMAAFLRAQS